MDRKHKLIRRYHVSDAAYTLIETGKLNGVDPQQWLAETLIRIPDYKINRVGDLLPWKST